MTIGIVKLLKLCYTLLLVRLLVLYNELAPVSSADQVISVPLWKFCRPWVTGYNDNVTCYLVVPSVPRTVSTTGHCIHVCIHVWQYVYIVTSLPVSNQLQIMCTIYIILTADHVYKLQCYLSSCISYIYILYKVLQTIQYVYNLLQMLPQFLYCIHVH